MLIRLGATKLIAIPISEIRASVELPQEHAMGEVNEVQDGDSESKGLFEEEKCPPELSPAD